MKSISDVAKSQLRDSAGTPPNEGTGFPFSARPFEPGHLTVSFPLDWLYTKISTYSESIKHRAINLAEAAPTPPDCRAWEPGLLDFCTTSKTVFMVLGLAAKR
jgi:hypothetical protein